MSLQLPCFLKACVLLRSYPELMGSSRPPVFQKHSCRMPVYPVSITHCAESSASTACFLELCALRLLQVSELALAL